MSAHYDSYDYPSYWLGREYEYKSEVIAIKAFLQKIKHIKTILDFGCGYGRLYSSYQFRADKIYLLDSSSKLLSIAKKRIKSKKVKYIHSKIENSDQYFKNNSLDVVILVRVLHHIRNIDSVLSFIYKMLKPGGFLILEFPNKKHVKEIFKQVLMGNITFPLDIFTKDIRSKKSIKNKTIPLYNFHPDYIFDLLKNNGFKLVEKRSVSNFRNDLFKSHLGINILLYFEGNLQRILSYINFGPSIFVLAVKKE